MKDPFYRSEKKRYKNPIPSREWIIQTLAEFNAPISIEQLKKLLKLKDKDAALAFTKRLSAMVRDGQLLKNRNNDYVLVKQMGLCRGNIHYGKDRQPYLFDDDTQKKMSISGYQLTELLENDYVLARSISAEQVIIIEILSRNLTNIIGRVQTDKGITSITPMKPCCYSDPILLPLEKDIPSGTWVNVSIVEYPKPGRPAIVAFEKAISNQQDINDKIDLICSAFGIPMAHERSYQFDDKICLEGRDDWRQLSFVTIDGDDAKDFDDAIYVEAIPSGYNVYVAIADVSHYVTPESEINEEAKQRSTSVYFPGYVVPMLPKQLSNDLCSLLPNQDRYVMGVKITLDKEGSVDTYTLHEAVIHSHARLTYKQVESFIQSADSIPKDLSHTMTPMISLAEKLMVLKEKRGALQFNRQECVPIIRDGCIVDFKQSVSLTSMQLVEVYMLLANELVARFCEKHQLPCLYRNHGQPDAEKLHGLFQTLNHLGIKAPNRDQAIHTKQLSKLMKKVHNKVNSHVYDILMLRALPQALYGPDCQGHYGLAYQHYLHFTSPIRRYPDLLVHQQLKHLMHGEATVVSDLNHMGSHCSYAERRAEQATRWLDNELKCEFIKQYMGQSFQGRISSVMNFGIFVTLEQFGIDGMVHISNLPKDYYDFDHEKICLVGRKSRRQFRLGDVVNITIHNIDTDQHRIDFLLNDTPKNK